jgi:hypothetical protein
MSDAETAEALAMCDAQFHPHALAALKHHSEKTGQDWHLTAVQKCEQKASTCDRQRSWL